jgi:two-component sensor histidine kinase/tetratricopeptide (TPR) repeat protein
MLKATVLMIPFVISISIISQQDIISYIPLQGKSVQIEDYKARDIDGEKIFKFKEAQNQQENMRAILRRAKRLYELGKYVKAEKLFIEVLEIAKKTSNLNAEAQALDGLGLTYSAFQKLPESIYALQQALLINKSLNNTKGTIRTGKILSDIYYSKGNYDSALHYADVSMLAATKLEMNHEIQVARLAKISALIRLKNWQECEKEITTFIKKPTDSSNSNLFVQFQSMMGNYYLAKGQQDLSKQHYEKALNKAITLDRPELLSVVYGNMIDSYHDKGDYKSGLKYLKKYKEIRNIKQSGENTETVFHNDLYKNEIYYLNIEKKLKDLGLRLEAEESRLKDEKLVKGNEERNSLERKNNSKDSLLLYQRSLLETQESLYDARAKESMAHRLKLAKDNELKSLKLTQAGQLTRNLIVGLSIVLLLGSIILYQYQRQKKKNAIIEIQKGELQILMKEIHHRVKNNLQVISSLLDLQSMSIQDSQASEAIKEGKNRVQSMALIHQNLYGERSMQKINAKEYIHNLSNGLIDSYNVKPGTIKINTDIDNVDLDVDTVIPLGLILNELISNSLKHAFKNRENGEINIELKEKDNSLFLKVKDNGQGFSMGTHMAETTSFGMKLIKAFATKLKAKLEMYNQEGACTVMHIHKYKPAS